MQKISFLENLNFEKDVSINKMAETKNSKEIKISMKQNAIMKEHTAPGAITIMVLKGEVEISSMSEKVLLADGEMVYFEAMVPHSLFALQNSIVRLVLSKNDNIQRIENLIKI